MSYANAISSGIAAMGKKEEEEEKEKEKAKDAKEEMEKVHEKPEEKKTGFWGTVKKGVGEFLEGAAAGSNPAAYRARHEYGEGGIAEQRMNQQELSTRIRSVNAGMYAAQQYGGMQTPEGQQAFNEIMNSLGMGHVRAADIAALQGTGLGGGPTGEAQQQGDRIPRLAATTEVPPQQPQTGNRSLGEQLTPSSLSTVGPAMADQSRVMRYGTAPPADQPQPASQNVQPAPVGEEARPVPLGKTGGKFDMTQLGRDSYKDEYHSSIDQLLTKSSRNIKARETAIAEGQEVVDNGDGRETQQKTFDQLGLTNPNQQKKFQELEKASKMDLRAFTEQHQELMVLMLDDLQNNKRTTAEIIEWIKKVYAGE